MRIISGKFKNKKLDFPKNFKTRPLKDNVRENVFNIFKHSNNINFKIQNAKVIDLYAGTGSFGLECISRNASEVLFVDLQLAIGNVSPAARARNKKLRTINRVL